MSNENSANFVSAEQCEQVLQKFNKEKQLDLKLLRYTILPAKEVKGFLGEYYHLIVKCRSVVTKENMPSDNSIEEVSEPLEDLEGHRNTTLKFFIKKLPLVHEKHEKVMIFRKECCLYNSLLSELQEYSPLQWCPNIYLCSPNIIVLQDLDELGYHTLAHKESLEKSEMLPILKGLASMHASSLLFEVHKKSIEETYSECLKEITVHPDIPWFTTGIKALIDIAKSHPRYQTEMAQHFIQEELPYHLKSIYFMVNPSTKYRNVVCHRDPWDGNIFLNPLDSEAAAIFVDFQTCRYCPPAIDVIFTLFMNLAKDELLERQTQYLQYYWQQLQTFVSNDDANDTLSELGESEFLESFKEFKLFGIVYRALAATILKVPTELVTDEYKNVERSRKLLEYMAENEEFRLLMEECIGDIIEAILDGSIISDMCC